MIASAGEPPGPVSHRHHFVSKRHVRRWAFDRADEPEQARVWTRRKRTGEVKPLPVKKVMVEIDHHLIRMKDGTDSSWIDSDLVGQLETTAVIVDALIGGTRTTATLAESDRRILAVFVNLLRGSDPSRLDAVVQRIDREPALRASFEDWLGHHPGKPDPVEARRQFALGGVLGEVLNGRQTGELVARVWGLFHVDPIDAATLILGDDPVVEYALPGSDSAVHTLVALPLNPWTLLVMHPVSGPDHPDGRLAPVDVALLNHTSWARTTTVAVAHDAVMLEEPALMGSTMMPAVLRLASTNHRPQVFV